MLLTVNWRISPVRPFVKRPIPVDGFGKSVAVIAAGTFIGQGFVAASSPLLTRLYDPAAFGVFAVFSSLLAILWTVAALRFEQAIALPERDEDAASILVLCLMTTLALSAIIGIAVFVFGGSLSIWTKVPILSAYLWLLPLGFFVAGLAQSLNYWFVRRGSYRSISKSNVAQGAGQALAQLGFGVVGAGPFGLIAGDVVGWVAGGSVLGLSLRKDWSLLRGVSFPQLRYIARRYKRFPLIASWSGLLNGAALQLPLLMIAAFYGPAVAALFGLSQQVVAVPVVFLGRAVAQVYLGELSRLMRGGETELRHLFVSTAKRLTLIAAIPMGIVLLWGPALFSVVFGARWRTAGEFAQVLSVMYLVLFVLGPLAWTLALVERQDLQLAWDFSRLVFSSGAVLVAGLLGWSALATVAVYGATMTVAYGALGWLSFKHLSRAGEEVGRRA